MTTQMQNIMPGLKPNVDELDDCIEGIKIKLTEEQILIEWDKKICRRLSRAVAVCRNEKDFIEELKDYLEMLEKNVLAYTTKIVFKEKIFKHLKVFYITRVDRMDPFFIKYLECMQELLVIFFNLELQMVPLCVKKNKDKTYNETVIQVAERLINCISIFLDYQEKRVFHVLIKLNDKLEKKVQKDVMELVYRHHLVGMPVKDKSDLYFAQNFLLFRKWKKITIEKKHGSMDRVLFYRFNRNPKCIEKNSTLLSILGPSTNIGNCAGYISRGEDAPFGAYLNFMHKKKGDDDICLTLSIDLDSEEDCNTTHTSSVQCNGQIKREKKHNKNVRTTHYVEVKDNTGALVCIIDDDDDDDSDVEVVSVSIINKKSSRRKRDNKPPAAEPVSFLDSIVLPEDVMNKEPNGVLGKETVCSSAAEDSSTLSIVPLLRGMNLEQEKVGLTEDGAETLQMDAETCTSTTEAQINTRDVLSSGSENVQDPVQCINSTTIESGLCDNSNSIAVNAVRADVDNIIVAKVPTTTSDEKMTEIMVQSKTINETVQCSLCRQTNVHGESESYSKKQKLCSSKPNLKTVESQTENIAGSFSYIGGMITPPSDRTLMGNSPTSMDISSDAHNSNGDNSNVYTYVSPITGLQNPYEFDTEHSGVCEISTQVNSYSLNVECQSDTVQSDEHHPSACEISTQINSFDLPISETDHRSNLNQILKVQNQSGSLQDVHSKVDFFVGETPVEVCSLEQPANSFSNQTEEGLQENFLQSSMEDVDLNVQEQEASLGEPLEKFILIQRIETMENLANEDEIEHTETEIEHTETEIEHTETEIAHLEDLIHPTVTEVDRLEAEVPNTEIDVEIELGHTKANIDERLTDVGYTDMVFDQAEMHIKHSESQLDNTENASEVTQAELVYTEVEALNTEYGIAVIQLGIGPEIVHVESQVEPVEEENHFQNEQIDFNNDEIVHEEPVADIEPEGEFELEPGTEVRTISNETAEQYKQIVNSIVEDANSVEYSTNEKTYADVNSIPIIIASESIAAIQESQLEVNIIPINLIQGAQISNNEPNKIILSDGNIFENDNCYISDKEFVVIPKKDDPVSNNVQLCDKPAFGALPEPLNNGCRKSIEPSAKISKQKKQKIQASVTMTQLDKEFDLRRKKANGQSTKTGAKRGEHDKKSADKIIFTSAEKVLDPLPHFSKYVSSQSDFVENAFSGPIEPLSSNRNIACDSNSNSNDIFGMFNSDQLSLTNEFNKSGTTSPSDSSISPPYEDIHAKEYESHVLETGIRGPSCIEPNRIEPHTDNLPKGAIPKGINKRKRYQKGEGPKKLKVTFGHAEVKMIENCNTQFVSDEVLDLARPTLKHYNVSIRDPQLVYKKPRVLVNRDAKKLENELRIRRLLNNLEKIDQNKSRSVIKDRINYNKSYEDRYQSTASFASSRVLTPNESSAMNLSSLQQEAPSVTGFPSLAIPYVSPPGTSGLPPAGVSGVSPFSTCTDILPAASSGFKRASEQAKGNDQKSVTDLNFVGKRRKRKDPVIKPPKEKTPRASAPKTKTPRAPASKTKTPSAPAPKTKTPREPAPKTRGRQVGGRSKKTETNQNDTGISYTDRPFRIRSDEPSIFL